MIVSTYNIIIRLSTNLVKSNNIDGGRNFSNFTCKTTMSHGCLYCIQDFLQIEVSFFYMTLLFLSHWITDKFIVKMLEKGPYYSINPGGGGGVNNGSPSDLFIYRYISIMCGIQRRILNTNTHLLHVLFNLFDILKQINIDQWKWIPTFVFEFRPSFFNNGKTSSGTIQKT